MIYYISDTHFGDLKVFNKCKRPFLGLDQLESEILHRWNHKVNNADTIYVLGDIAEDNYIKTIDIFRNLKGHKHLIIGNHDITMLDDIVQSNVFETVEIMKFIEDNGRKVCLCHYPLMEWVDFNKGGYHVYGHIHNKTVKNDDAYLQMKEYVKDKRCFNASVDVTNYEPVTLDEMIRLKEVNAHEPYIN